MRFVATAATGGKASRARKPGATRPRSCKPKARDLALIDGDPTADIIATRRITGVWRGGVRWDLAGYVGSDDESLGLQAFHAQTDRVITAARALWPRDATDLGWDGAAGPGSDA